jgi:heptosyltransferase II
MKILVRATNWVGDAIMSIPALQAIRQRWPDAEIAILARPWVAELYRGQDFADRIVTLTAPSSNPIAIERAAEGLRAEQFDCAVLLQNAFSAAWLAWRAKIPQRIGYARNGRSILLTQAIAVPKHGEVAAHEAYYYLALLQRAGWLESIPKVEQISLRLSAETSQAAEKRLRDAGLVAGKKRVAVAPGAAYGSAKCWPAERFAAVADALVDDFSVDVVLFGSNSEIDICRQITEHMRHRAVTLAGQTSIGELPALFSRCHLFVGNDSGAMHVAGAVGVPVVAVFGSTDPEGTAPMTSNQTIIQHKVSCSPCFLRECPIDHRCMERVPVQEVRDAGAKWLQQEKYA